MPLHPNRKIQWQTQPCCWRPRANHVMVQEKIGYLSTTTMAAHLQTRPQESTTHAKMRLNKAIEQGMRNPSNLYLMAKSCLECHTVPNEELVNLGGHSAGSLTFEFVSWSQGTLRHNFMRTNGISNAESSQARKRIMWIAGLMADLEFSTRATGNCDNKAKVWLDRGKTSGELRFATLRGTTENQASRNRNGSQGHFRKRT